MLGEIKLVLISACKMKHITAICQTGAYCRPSVRLGAYYSHYFYTASIVSLIDFKCDMSNNVIILILVHAVNQQNKAQCQVVIREVITMSTVCELIDISSLGKSMFREVHQRGAGRGQECYCMHYIITRVVGENILGDFNLAVSTPTTKPPNLISRQIFRL